MVEFRMPSLGADMEAGTLVAYRCEPGMRVDRGDIIAEVETDKGVIEVESYVSGVLDHWVVPVGTRVPVGAALAVLREEGAAVAVPSMPPPAAVPVAAGQGAYAPSAGYTPPPAAMPVAAGQGARTPSAAYAPPPAAASPPLAVSRAGLEGTNGSPARAAPQPTLAGRAALEEAEAAPPTHAQGSPAARDIRATPSARKRARELGVDLQSLAQDRPVTAADVERAAARHEAPPAEPTRPAHLRTSPAAMKRARELGVDLSVLAQTSAPIHLADVERLARSAAALPDRDLVSGPRRVIAAAMARAKREIPHYYLSTTVDLGAASRWLEAHNAERSVRERLLLGVLFLRAVALATQRTPDFNVRWTDAGPQRQPDVHLGVAISLRGGGLVSPAIASAQALALPQLMAAFQDVVARARSGRLRSTELTSGTITVTSLGERGVDAVFPIIHPPQSAIVGFGRSALRPWVVNGELCARPLVQVTLAADHRITDGHAGARYLALIEQLLQEPERL